MLLMVFIIGNREKGPKMTRFPHENYPKKRPHFVLELYSLIKKVIIDQKVKKTRVLSNKLS